jgi:hypothetical protein
MEVADGVPPHSGRLAALHPRSGCLTVLHARSGYLAALQPRSGRLPGSMDTDATLTPGNPPTAAAFGARLHDGRRCPRLPVLARASVGPGRGRGHSTSPATGFFPDAGHPGARTVEVANLPGRLAGRGRGCVAGRTATTSDELRWRGSPCSL